MTLMGDLASSVNVSRLSGSSRLGPVKLLSHFRIASQAPSHPLVNGGRPLHERSSMSLIKEFCVSFFSPIIFYFWLALLASAVGTPGLTSASLDPGHEYQARQWPCMCAQ